MYKYVKMLKTTLFLSTALLIFASCTGETTDSNQDSSVENQVTNENQVANEDETNNELEILQQRINDLENELEETKVTPTSNTLENKDEYEAAGKYYTEFLNDEIYALYYGNGTGDNWNRELWKLNPYGDNTLLYQAEKENIQFCLCGDTNLVAVESNQTLTIVDSQGNIVKEILSNQFELDQYEEFRLFEWNEETQLLWFTVQNMYIVTGYATLDMNDWSISTYSYPLNFSDDYDIDTNSGWVLSSDYPVFLDVDSRNEYLNGNPLTTLYLYNIFTEDKHIVDIGTSNLFEPHFSGYGGLFEYRVDTKYYQSSIDDVLNANTYLSGKDILYTDGIQVYVEGSQYLEDGVICNVEKYNHLDFLTWHKTWNHIPVDELSTHSKPAVIEDTVFIVIDKTLYALDYETGETLWSLDKVGSSSTSQAPIVDSNGNIYLSGQYEPNLTAVNPKGQLLWQVNSDDLFGIQELKIIDSQLIVTVDADTAYTYDLKGNRMD